MTEANDRTALHHQGMPGFRAPMPGLRARPAGGHAVVHLGERLQETRKAAGLTQGQLGKLIGCSRQAIARLEDAADPRPSLRQLHRISEVLGAPVASLLGTATDGDDPVNRRQLLQATAIGATTAVTARPALGAVGAGDVAEISQAIEDLRRMDQRTGGEPLRYFAARLVRDAEHLLTGRLSPRIADQLQTVHGKAAVLAGWLAQDSGKHKDASQHYATAMTASQLAGDSALMVEVCAFMAFNALKQLQPSRALQCAQAGQRAAVENRSGPRTRALLAAREAIARGHLGDAAGVDAAVQRTWRAFESGKGTDQPWVAFVTESELAGMVGQAYSLAHQYEPGLRSLEAAAQMSSVDHPRNAASWQAYLAIQYAKAGDPGQAAHLGTALLPVAQTLSSARVRADIQTIADLLRPHSTVAEVQNFTTQATAVGLVA